MARALMGHVGSSHDHLLAYEVARLRRRVAELEAELAETRSHHAELLDVELHHLASEAAVADAASVLA